MDGCGLDYLVELLWLSGFVEYWWEYEFDWWVVCLVWFC